MASKLAPRIYRAHAIAVILAFEDHNIRDGHAELDASKNKSKIADSARVGQVARNQPAKLIVELCIGDGAMECCRQIIREQNERRSGVDNGV